MAENLNKTASQQYSKSLNLKKADEQNETKSLKQDLENSPKSKQYVNVSSSINENIIKTSNNTELFDITIQDSKKYSNLENIVKSNIGNETKPVDVNNSYIEPYPLLSGYVETKIFEMKNENAIIRITPKHLVFQFNTETMKVEKECKEFKILNISPSPVKILIMPRQTKHFKFHYKSTNWIVPGIPLIIKVSFTPDESRDYFDWLRVCCASGSNLMVPIKAEASHKNLLMIPDKINFGFVPIGKRVTHKITLHPMENEIIHFMFVIVKETLGCEIHPSQGKVEGKPIEIEISYRPSCYITVSIPVQLYIPPLVMTPYYFTIEAYTWPVEKQSETLVSTQPIPSKSLEHENKHDNKLSPDFTIKRVLPKCEMKDKRTSTSKLFTQHEVNLLLIRKDVQSRDPDEQLGPYGVYMDEVQKVKETTYNNFSNAVKKLQRMNGELKLTCHKEFIYKIQCSDDEREEIQNENYALWDHYNEYLNPINESTQPLYIRQKIILRNKMKQMKSEPEESDLWKIRNRCLWAFIQIGRRIILQNRMLNRLKVFKELTPTKIEELDNEITNNSFQNIIEEELK